MHSKIDQYIQSWRKRGYGTDIPDEVPEMIRTEGLAPSYKAIALAILSHDHGLRSLGYAMPDSPWYRTLKAMELQGRESTQLLLF